VYFTTFYKPLTLAVWPKAWVLAAGYWNCGSIPAQGMDVWPRRSLLWCPEEVEALRLADYPNRGPTKCPTEAQNLLGCTAVFLIGCRTTFQRCVLPPSDRYFLRPYQYMNSVLVS
jgi:hypothetical protein